MNILETIVAHKKTELARRPPEDVTAAGLRKIMDERADRRDFQAALRCPGAAKISLIAEVKKASPSAGVICQDFDPARIATQYEAAGAQCISVLTDERFFQGSLDCLRSVRQAVKLPLLRKDFIIDARQIQEAIEWGADAILLIAAILADRELNLFHGLAASAGLSALVEVHDEAELDRAMDAGSQIIGVNNRNLKTFKVDLGTTERLASRLRRLPGGDDKLLVAESGIKSYADVKRLIDCGAQAILVGESLMRASDVKAKVRDLICDPNQSAALKADCSQWPKS